MCRYKTSLYLPQLWKGTIMSKYGIQIKGTGRAVFKSGGRVNTSRENRLEELGRVDAERARTRKGKRNLKDEKRRIVKELKK